MDGHGFATLSGTFRCLTLGFFLISLSFGSQCPLFCQQFHSFKFARSNILFYQYDINFPIAMTLWLSDPVSLSAKMDFSRLNPEQLTQLQSVTVRTQINPF